MSYQSNYTLREPQRFRDNAPMLTPIFGYNNIHQPEFRSPILPNFYVNSPRSTNQNYIGRKTILPETQNFDGTYQPKLENDPIALEDVALRRIGGIVRPMFSVY